MFRSTLWMPSTRSPEKYRGAFPGTWSPGSAKQFGLRKVSTGGRLLLMASLFACQFKATVCTLVPVLSCEHTTWGRWLPLASRALDMPIAIGCPDCSVMIDDSDQP